jgi:hypothetical protein
MRKNVTPEIVINALANATTHGAYRYAKTMAARLPIAEQATVVDAFIAARRRIEALEVAATV